MGNCQLVIKGDSLDQIPILPTQFGNNDVNSMRNKKMPVVSFRICDANVAMLTKFSSSKPSVDKEQIHLRNEHLSILTSCSELQTRAPITRGIKLLSSCPRLDILHSDQHRVKKENIFYLEIKFCLDMRIKWTPNCYWQDLQVYLVNYMITVVLNH